MNKKNLRRVSYLVTAQTDYHINKLAERENKKPGEILNELVRNHMLKLKGDKISYNNEK